MKLKKVNKVLSITLASAMLVSSVPVNTFADEAESELATEQAEKKEEKAEKAAVKAESSNPAEEGSKEAKVASAKDAENTNKGDASGSGEVNSNNTNNETPTGSGEANSGNANNETPTGSGEANGGNTNNETPTGSGEVNGGNTNNETPTGSGEANGGNTNNETPAGSGEANGGNANNGSSSGSGNENGNDANNNSSADNGNSGKPGNGNTEDGNNNNKPGEDNKKTEVTYSVSWDYETPYTYTGAAQVPEAKVTTAAGAEIDKSKYEVQLSGDAINAGTYTAKVVITDKDSNTTYKLSGSAEQKFTIEKRKIDKFDKIETQLPYTGAVQAPIVTCKDVNGAEIQCEVEPDKDAINVRENAYKAKASLPDAYKTNYTLVEDGAKVEEKTIDYWIVQATATVDWRDITFGYDAEPHVPTFKITDVNNTELKGTSAFYNASADDKKQGDPIDGSKCVNAGKYVAEIALNEEDAKNYNLTNASVVFEIEKADAVIEWNEIGEPKYKKRQVQATTVKQVTNKNNDTLAVDVEVTYKKGEQVISKEDCIDAGSYSVEVQLKDTSNYNALKVEDSKRDFTIEKADVKVDLGTTEFFYDGKSHSPEPTVKDESENELEKTVNFYKADAQGEKGELVDADQCIDAGDYFVEIQLSENETKNYNWENVTDQFKIKQSGVIVEWSGDPFVYNGKYQAPEPTVTVKEGANKETELITPDDYTVAVKGVESDAAMDAGTYTATVTLENENYKQLDETVQFSKEFKIQKQPVHITAKDATKTYGLVDYGFEYDDDQIKDELAEVGLYDDFKSNLEASGFKLTRLKDDTGEDVTEEGEGYTISYTIEEGKESELRNYDIKYTSAKLTITPLSITVTPKQDSNTKFYGEEDPDYYDYAVEINWSEADADRAKRDGYNDPEKIKSELYTENEQGERNVNILERASGEDVKEGGYAFSYIGNNKNYTVKQIAEDAPTFEIKALPITITPNGETKLYGEKDPEFYAYNVTIGDETISEADFKKNMREDFLTEKAKTAEEAIANELGNAILRRAQGENPNEYAYSYITEGANTNYAVAKIVDAAPKFVIQNLTIDVPKSIGSRQTSFTVETNLKDKQRPENAEQVSTGNLADVQTKVVVTDVVLPTETDGITFPTDMDAYISESSTGILFNGQNPKVSVNTVDYAKGEQSWVGKLPAGTTFKVQVVNAEGKPVSDAKEVTVTKKNVSLGNWGTYLGTSADGRNFIKNDVALTNELDSDTEELVEVAYKSNAKSDKATETVYKFSKKGESFSYQPKVNNEANAHVTQSLTASIVDTLNLTCESKSDTFYVDNEAFQASTVEFKNRATEMTITLPEYGTIDSVEIAGATVTVGGEKAKEFTLPVKWSGKELVQSGSGIKVQYTDEAGNKGTGTGTVARSSVSTPIRFKIKPELNGAGYLNGRSSTLLISGTACACEQIRISVAGSTQTTYATQKETWSDENGSWEVAVSMDSLPEGDDFEISAEYVDVDGAGYTMTAKYNAYCADTAVLSPIYEAMTCLSGMVEPQTTIALVLNGESQEFYEIEVDRFGHFVLDDVPMMFAGESFDIYVTDIAGNQSISHYEIPELEDPFEIKSTVNPLGKFFYFGERSGSEAYLATPVSAADFTEEKDHIELPLLMGGSYEVGTMTLQKTENGFTVSSELQVSENIDPEDYSVENEKLYVYTSRPTMDDLRNRTGQEYAYGEEIPFGENETVWIVDQKDMTILADSVMDLDVFKFGESEEYEAYQER